MRTSDDDLLPELPPLLDDGESVGEESYDFDLDDPDDEPWDDGLALVEDEAIPGVANDDDASWLDDRTAADVDLGDAEGLGSEPEYGFLDDSPLDSLDLGLDDSEEGPAADDGGEEGTEDPLMPSVEGDDDATDLPVMEESEDDGEGPDEESIGGALDDDGEEPTPRTHRGV